MVKSFQYRICHMSPKARRSSRIKAIRKKSAQCPSGKIPKCFSSKVSKRKGMAYCGKNTRKKKGSRKKSRSK